MPIVTMKIKMYVEEDFVDELKRIVDHHADYLLDLAEFPEIYEVFDGEITVDEED